MAFEYEYINRLNDTDFGRLATQADYYSGRTSPNTGRPVTADEVYYGGFNTQMTPGSYIGAVQSPEISAFANQDLGRELPVGPEGPINPVVGDARAVLDGYTNWTEEQVNNGIGFLPPPLPVMDFDQNRDPVTGDYLSYEVDPQWGDMDPRVRALNEFYLDPAMGRMNATIAETNRDRLAVQQAAQPIEYTAPRSVGTFDPMLGITTYRTVNDRLYAPFLPGASQFVGG